MREQTEENKSIKRFAYTGPATKKYPEVGGYGNPPGFGFSRPHHSKKTAFEHEEPWKDKSVSGLLDMALPTSPRTSTTGFYSRYSNYLDKKGKTGQDLPGNSSPSNIQQSSGGSGVSWNQSRSGYSYSQHDPKMTQNSETRTSKESHTRNRIPMQKAEDTSGAVGRYPSQPTSRTNKASASSSWNDL